MIIVILLLAIIALLSVLFYYKSKSENIEKEVSKGASTVKNLEITKTDEKLISDIFNKKITRTFFGNNKKIHSFSYSKNEYSFGGCNSEFDVVKTEINKLSINNEIFFNVEFKAWKKLLDYKTEQPANVEITNIVSNPENLKEQVSNGVLKLFKKLDNDLEEEIQIENT